MQSHAKENPHDLSDHLSQVQAHVDQELKQALDKLPGVPGRLRAAMEHGLMGGGKRLRPIFCLAAADAVGGAEGERQALPAALALEFVHAYSLIHDDLPAMDDDAMRRGKPTVHVEYGEADAILAGDALLTEAFGVLARAQDVPPERIVRATGLLAMAAGSVGMVGGQHLDLAHEGKEISLADLEDLAGRKTGALLTASCVLGGVMAGASPEMEEAFRVYGQSVGLAFQMVDDLLDATGDEKVVGKATGKDADRGKTNFVSALGVEGVKSRAAQEIETALEVLEPWGEKAEALRALAQFVIQRTH